VTSNPFAPGQPWLADHIEAVAPVQHAALFPPVEEAQPAELAELVIRVVGEVAPQGSMNGYLRGRKVVLVPTNKAELDLWRGQVADAAKVATRAWLAEHHTPWVRLDGAIEIGAVFFLERPASAPRHREWPEKFPDIDKCTRAIFDALKTGGAIYDDARCVHADAWQVYAKPGVPLGARITVRNGVDESRPVVSPRARKGSE
jgi:Holliday junction resolvase RusA-like endonuclease